MHDSRFRRVRIYGAAPGFGKGRIKNNRTVRLRQTDISLHWGQDFSEVQRSDPGIRIQEAVTKMDCERQLYRKRLWT